MGATRDPRLRSFKSKRGLTPLCYYRSMPRPPRQFEINGIYHVVKRATEGRIIFDKTQDPSRFILGLEFFNDPEPINLWTLIAGSDPAKLGGRLEEQRNKKQTSIVELLAFALMPNHIHLILREIRKNGISKYIQKLGGYSTYFNKQYHRAGSLFQSRFKAIRVKDDIQLNAVFCYVHTNPIELWETGWKERRVKDPAEAIKKLEEYWASSYNDYIGKPRFPHAINRKFFLDFYGGEQQCRQAVEDWVRISAGSDPAEIFS